MVSGITIDNLWTYARRFEVSDTILIIRKQDINEIPPQS